MLDWSRFVGGAWMWFVLGFVPALASAEPLDGGSLDTEVDAVGSGPTEPEMRWFVGTSAFVLANVVPSDHPPNFGQFNVGFRLTDRDIVSVEMITWRYDHPLGIPYGSSFQAPQWEYPGFVREVGAGLAYQRVLWRGLYASASFVPLWRRFVGEEGETVGHGFQLFSTFRVGWYVPFLRRFFVEPSIALTWWPISTGAPAGFAALDRRWPSYFPLEPGLHVGVRF